MVESSKEGPESEAVHRGPWRMALVALCVVSVLWGAGLRLVTAATHFTHVDDVMVAVNTLRSTHFNDVALGDDPELGMVLEPDWERLQSVGLLHPWLVLLSADIFARRSTYAPVQLLLNHLFVDRTQDYRGKLFWGRMPSVLEGIGAVLAMVLLVTTLAGGGLTAGGLLSVFLLSASWMAVVYSGQMHPYGFGVFTSAATLALLGVAMFQPAPSLRRLLALSVALAASAWSNYQNLFVAPAAFAAVWALHGARPAGAWRRLVVPFVAAGGLYGLLVAPLLRYLRAHVDSGVGWNAGPNKEFLFAPGAVDGLFAKGWYVLRFFVTNAYEVTASNLAVTTPDSVAWPLVGLGGLALGLLGLGALLRSDDPRRRGLGVYLLVAMACWTALVLVGKLTLGPTRHSLFLLPSMALAAGAGLDALLARVREAWEPKARAVAVGLLGVLLVVSLVHAPAIVRTRTDAFDEEALFQLLDEHHVDLLFGTHCTQQPALMSSVMERFPFFFGCGVPPTFVQPGLLTHPPVIAGARTIALVSHRGPPQPIDFPEGVTLPDGTFLVLDVARDYDLVASSDRPSVTEIDLSDRMQNGGNGLFVRIYRWRGP